MDIKAYFAESDTPSEGSPVGALMLKVLAKNPGMTFDAARQEANRLLDAAAGRRVFVTPRVYSEQEKADNAARLRAAFTRSDALQAVA